MIALIPSTPEGAFILIFIVCMVIFMILYGVEAIWNRLTRR